MPLAPFPQSGFSDSALLLRLSPRGESDLMVDMFTRNRGRLRVLAKGAKRSKKRFMGTLLTNQVIRAELTPFRKGGDLLSLASAELERGFNGLRGDFRKFLAAAPVGELLLHCTAQADPQAKAFDLAVLTLAGIEQAGKKGEAASALLIYLARLLSEMGYGLSLECCLACGQELGGQGEAYLSLQGGAVCGCCPETASSHGRYAVPPGLVKSMEAAASLDIPALARLRLAPALLEPGLAFLTRFWQQVAGRQLLGLGLAAGALRALERAA